MAVCLREFVAVPRFDLGDRGGKSVGDLADLLQLVDVSNEDVEVFPDFGENVGVDTF